MPEAVRETGADILLGNTYHLMLRPGAERIAALGGLHRFMNWPRPILTDSGGFQVMSLSELRKVTEQGVRFRSHIDGAMFDLSPERAVEIQALLGADISMQLDECIRLPAPREEIERAMLLSLRWAERSRRAFEAHDAAVAGRCSASSRAATTSACAAQSARELVGMGFQGHAVGGLAVGEPQATMLNVVEEVAPAASGRPAALSHGRRHAGRSARSGGARHRHVRLRHAHPQRPARPGVQPVRADQSRQCPPSRRSAAA